MPWQPGYSTGLTTKSGDILPMRDNPTLPRVLSQAGCQTRAQGKMHDMPKRANYGFEHMELSEKPLEKMKAVGSSGVTNGAFDIEPVDEPLKPEEANRCPGYHSTTFECDLLHNC